MKTLTILLLVLLFAGITSAYAPLDDPAADLEIAKGPNFPVAHDWMQVDDVSQNYTLISQWKITNNYSKDIRLSSMVFEATGTLDDARMYVWVNREFVVDGLLTLDDDVLGGTTYAADNATKEVSFEFGYSARVLESGKAMYVAIFHKAEPNFYEEGTKTGHILQAINATVIDTGEHFTKTFGTKIFQSPLATITYPKRTYFIRAESAHGKAYWIRSTPYADGNAYVRNHAASGDYGFIAYTDCSEETSSELDEGYDNIQAFDVIGQTFKSSSNNVTAVALYLRGKMGEEEDTVTVKLYDTPDGRVISSSTKTIAISGAGKWYFFDLNTCVASCGNGMIDSGEQCDGANIGGAECGELEGFFAGSLSCDASCRLETISCHDLAESLELECEMYGLEGADYSCTRLNDTFGTSYTSGGFIFDEECNADLSGCSNAAEPVCGNREIEEGEECDGGMELSGTCHDSGFYNGFITCSDTCTVLPDECLDFTGFLEKLCVLIGPPEEGYVPCANFNNGDEVNFVDGNVYFDAGCVPDISECVSAGEATDGEEPSETLFPQVCGNNIAEGTESCDGTDLRGNTCPGFGGDGALNCTAFCTFDESDCFSDPSGPAFGESPPAGDGVIPIQESPPAVEDVIPMDFVCGNNIVEFGEDCEADDLHGAACETFGYNKGELDCNATCGFDTGNCIRVNEAGEIIAVGSTDGAIFKDAGSADTKKGIYQNEISQIKQDYTLLIALLALLILIIAIVAYYLSKKLKLKPKKKK